MILLALLIALSPPAGACACTCMGPGPLDQAVADAEAVFVGRVATITWDARMRNAQVTLRVARAWKWPGAERWPPAVLVVETAPGPACGAYFGEGEEWLVFPHRAEGQQGLRTGQCSGTDAVERRGTELWQHRERERVRKRLAWLRRHVGRGSRPAP